MLPRPRLEKILERTQEIETLLAQPEVARDPGRTQALAKELSDLSGVARAYRSLRETEREVEEAAASLKDPTLDKDLRHLYEEEKESLLKKKNLLEQKIETELVKGKDSDAGRNTIVEIRAGTGGEEASLFARDLFRMYLKYAQAHGLGVEVMTSALSEKGGFKEVVFGVSGPAAYRRFRFESGIHRVQRVPETEASGRIHTSAVTVAVLPEAEEVEVQINPADLKIETFRSSGPGGQHVNKTNSAIRITHLPTQLVVACQDEKSQHKNKARAMRVLRARLFEIKRREHDEKIQATRKKHIGSGDRSGKIRTYNFHDRRVTDHRVGLTLHNPDDILDGHLEELFEALEKDDKARRMARETDGE